MIAATAIALHLQASVVAGGLTQSIAPANHVDVNTRVTSGTGLSIAGGDARSLTARSPVFLNLEVGARLDTLSWLEFSGGVAMELENRVSVGILPRLRAFVPVRRPMSVYFIGAAPVFVHPFTLVGAQGGLGVGVTVSRHVSIVAELTATGYFAGTDLMAGSALGKFDAALGINVSF